MQVTVDRTAPCVAKVSLSVDFDEFEAERKKLLATAGKQMKVKGFRPGHVPPAVAQRLHGREIEQDTKRAFLDRAYQQAVAEKELQVLSQPRIDLPDGAVLAGASFSMSFELQLRPEFELGVYQGLEATTELVPPSAEEVEAAIEQVAKNQARPEPVGEEGLPADGMALCKVELLHHGEVVFSREGLRLSPKTQVPGIDPEAFEKGLTGTRDGAVVELEAVFPDDFEVESARGQKGLCRLTVAQAFRVVVPTRAELLGLLKLDNDEALVVRVREKLDEANRDLDGRRIEGLLLERLIDTHPMDLPEAMLARQKEARLEQIRQELVGNGLAPDKLEAELRSQDAAAATWAERAMRGFFLVEKIGHKESLQVTEDELVRELRQIAQRNNTNFEQVRDYYRERNLVNPLAAEILERKVRRFLRDKAKVTQAGGAA